MKKVVYAKNLMASSGGASAQKMVAPKNLKDEVIVHGTSLSKEKACVLQFLSLVIGKGNSKMVRLSGRRHHGIVSMTTKIGLQAN